MYPPISMDITSLTDIEIDTITIDARCNDLDPSSFEATVLKVYEAGTENLVTYGDILNGKGPDDKFP